MSLIHLCVSTLSLVAKEGGSSTHSYTPIRFTSLEQDDSDPFLSQYLYIVYKPSSTSCPEEMVSLGHLTQQLDLQDSRVLHY